MSSKVFFGLLIIVAGILVGWYVFGGSPAGYMPLIRKQEVNNAPPTGKMTGENLKIPTESAGISSGEKGGVSARGVVTYTNTGFAPDPLTVTKGTTVTFVNESTRGMWVASATHPTHQLLPGFDQLTSVPNGGVYEYTFENVGTWKYHNHVNPTDIGSILVTE